MDLDGSFEREFPLRALLARAYSLAALYVDLVALADNRRRLCCTVVVSLTCVCALFGVRVVVSGYVLFFNVCF